MKEAGIPVTKFLTFHYTEKEKLSYEEIGKQIGTPFMVKSSSLGSSVGVSKAKDENSFREAVEEAFRYDDYLIVEEFIKGREIECAILGNRPPQASNPGEIVISSKYEFYTFDAKYVDPDAVKIELPAKLSTIEVESIRDLSVKAYKALYCEDFSRVDLFLTEDGRIYINEINTIPGFTNSSMYPMMWKERGISFTQLITQLLDLAFERYERSKRIEREFNSALKF
jgi:D-alanine-D-alanine ligase